MQENIYIYTHIKKIHIYKKNIYICTYVIGTILKYTPKTSISTEANSTTICFAPLEVQSLHTKDAD